MATDIEQINLGIAKDILAAFLFCDGVEFNEITIRDIRMIKTKIATIITTKYALAVKALKDQPNLLMNASGIMEEVGQEEYAKRLELKANIEHNALIDLGVI